MVRDEQLVKSCRLVPLHPHAFRYNREVPIITGVKIVDVSGQKAICMEVT